MACLKAKITSADMERTGIIHTLTYFSVFSYPPTLTEVHAFLPFTCTREQLTNELHNMEEEAIVVCQNGRFALKQHEQFFNIYERRSMISYVKKQKIMNYLSALKRVSFIKSIAITGSVSMLNADEDGDVDLFIVTKAKRLWTARLIALLLAQAYGIRRHFGAKIAMNSICINLLFDERYLEIPDVKKNEYVGHELLQMMKINDVDHTLVRLIYSNKWVFRLFPNARHHEEHRKWNIDRKESAYRNHLVGDLVEYLAKKIQLFFIRRHTTTERISDKQLWFFPHDFQKKLEKKVEITSL